MYKTESLPNHLCQGDIILNYKSDELHRYYPKEFYKGILILSFTCDLKYRRVNFINLCPIFSLKYLIIILFKKFSEACRNAKPKN